MANRHQRLHLRRRPLARVAVAVGVSLALLLTLNTSAGADSGSLVPSTGKVAGEGYAYWLERSWQTIFSSSVPIEPCQALTANGQSVGYLALPTIDPGSY